MYYRLYEYALRTQQKELADKYLLKAVEAIQITYHIMKEAKCEMDDIAPSFFMGPVGIYTMAAIVYSHIDGKDAINVKKYVQKVLSVENMFEEDNQESLEDELLYGSAGYLYCLLLLKSKLGHGGLIGFHADIDRVIHKVVDAIMV